MSLTINVAPEVEQRLHDKAARSGVTLNVFVQSIIEREAQNAETRENDNQTLSSVSTNAQRAAAWRLWCEGHRQMNLPSLSPSAFERASFYGEHGLGEDDL